MSADYTLYGAPLSFYTGKARAYLDHKKIPYQEVLSTVGVYKKIIVPNTGVRMIPVVKTPGQEYIQDTCAIIESLEGQHPERPILPQTPKQKLVSMLFELWSDEWLLLPAMHYRWNKDNFPFIFKEFGRVVLPWAPGFMKAWVGKKIGSRFRGFVPMLGINDRTIPEIENWYENHVLHHLNKHFDEYDFLLGATPSLGDIALMGPLYAHLYRDPAPGKLMRDIAPNVVAWINRMQSPLDESGEWLANDEIPQTLLPLLVRMFDEQWPVLLNTVVQLEEWAVAYPEITDIPRSIGEHEFRIGNTQDKRVILTFHQWKLQRVLGCYQSMSDSQKAIVEPLLEQVNGLEAMQFSIKRPVCRKNNRLVFE